MAALRFVILRHEGIEHPHFDLMFETVSNSPLATWRSDVWPVVQPTPITQLADHRQDYLIYEGPISGNRGHVRQLESGTYQLEHRQPERWQLTLSSGRSLSFRRTSADQWVADPHP